VEQQQAAGILRLGMANRSLTATLDEGRLLWSAASSRRRLSLVDAYPD
jgi:hypothetical protein